MFVKIVLPLGLDVGILGVAAYYITRLKKPDPNNVVSIFGPDPWSKESDLYPEKVVKCIAHRGAGLDAPENTIQAFKYNGVPQGWSVINFVISYDGIHEKIIKLFNLQLHLQDISTNNSLPPQPNIKNITIKMCVERDCHFVELDVRSSRDGRLVLLHDQGLGRLTGTDITDVHIMDWEKIKNIDIGATHPNRQQFKEVHLCLLDDALNYLLANNVRMIIDIKGEDKQVVNGILKAFSNQPALYRYAVVTSFNPFVLYQIRKRDPQVVGAISYRPYCFSAQDYDAENGPNNPRFGDNLPVQALLRVADLVHSLLWRWSARWCAASAVLLHKDIVSPSEVQYWRSLGIRCAGWSVNRPLEKLYWRGVLRAPYLASTLLGEPDVDEQKRVEKRSIKEVD